jgi:hypothetical protein
MAGPIDAWIRRALDKGQHEKLAGTEAATKGDGIHKVVGKSRETASKATIFLL